MLTEVLVEQSPAVTVNPEGVLSIMLDPAQVDNALLKRLISEVQFDEVNHIHAYNRTHNRHNRGR